MMGQGVAMNMQLMAKGLLVYRITGSASILGVMALANAVPMLFFSFFGGVLADRVPKKQVFLWGMLASAALAAGIGFSLATGYLSKENPGSWWVIVAAALFQGAIQGVIGPARQAMVVEIVGEERLMNALSLSSLEMNAFRLVAPLAAGFLIDQFGFQAVYYVMAVMYLSSAALVVPLKVRSMMSLGGRGTLGAMADGFRYVRREPILLTLLVIIFFTVLLSMPYNTLMPIITEDILKVGASGMGILMGTAGVGAVVAAVVMASLPNKRRGVMLMTGCGVMGVALVGFSFSTWWSVSLAFMVFVGIGQTVRQSLASTLLQYYADPRYRGRVMSFMMMEFGLSSFGAFFTALAAEAIGVQWAIGGLAMILIVMAIGVLAFMPKVRRLD
jgi:MFS family permease